MSIPSFDELKKQAEAIGRSRTREAAVNTEEHIWRGVSDFVTQLLSAGTPQEKYEARITPQGEMVPLEKPVYRGGTVLQRAGRWAAGRGWGDEAPMQTVTERAQGPQTAAMAASGASPGIFQTRQEPLPGMLVKREESLPFLMESLKHSGREELVKLRAIEQAKYFKPTSTTQLMPDYIVKHFFKQILKTEAPEHYPMTVAQFGEFAKAYGQEAGIFLRGLGVLMDAGKDNLFGGTLPSVSQNVQKKIVERETPPPKESGGGYKENDDLFR